jgi:hypothetical protein
MSRIHRRALAATLTVALLLGFVQPDAESRADADRLHIFLFNLSFGAAILLWSARGRLPTQVIPWWLALSMGYALSAYLEVYAVTLLLSVPLFLLVETTRASRFPVIPRDLLQPGDLAARFLHTSLACLSLALASCSMVIANTHLLRGQQTEALDLDTFFLFYSFPISLAVFSAIFTLLPELPRTRAEFSYWGITGGVVAFFLAIVTGHRGLEMLAGSTLLLVIAFIATTFARRAAPGQERAFLLSGLGFLVAAGLTGVGYIAANIWPELAPIKEHVLMLHATVALYGWNLAGLVVILNWGRFPIVRRAGGLVALHWVTILILVPVGKIEPVVALVAIPAFAVLAVRTVALTPPGPNASPAVAGHRDAAALGAPRR